MMEVLFVVFIFLLIVFGLIVFRGAPYVPTHSREVDWAFKELYRLSDRDVVVDVGSGDGIILRTASSRGAKSIGYELNPLLVMVSRLLSRGDRKVKVELADFWLKQLPRATTIVYAFIVSRDAEKLATKMQIEANRLNRPLFLMTYGASLDNMAAMRESRGHHLYEFLPLQTAKA